MSSSVGRSSPPIGAALDLAERAGIQVPTRRLERIDGKAVLLLDRFDQTADSSRIAYILR
jgi:serine/threonine-protein kinase HipA